MRYKPALLKIPATMATQHPDCASLFLSASDELQEAVTDFTSLKEGGFGCEEKMVDFEGKLTPYHQPRWILDKVCKELKLKPGEDFLLTPRVPHERLEAVDRQVMILWSSISTNKYSQEWGGDAVKYLIHPMTESGLELLISHRRLIKLLKFGQSEIGLRTTTEVRLIPLFENVIRLLHIDEIMESYRTLLMRELGAYFDYYRVFLGKSDPAILYGHPASFLALKYSLSRLEKWADRLAIKVYPMLGVGKLPFRGHLSPENVENFVKEWSGYFTVTIQSGLRYDVGHPGVDKVVEAVKENAGKSPITYDVETEQTMLDCLKIFAKCYIETILPLSQLLCTIADRIPARRERVEREIYSRDFSPSITFIGDRELRRAFTEHEVALPRAIKFTAALYTMGFPPSIIGLGRGLRTISKRLGEGVAEDLAAKICAGLRFDVGYDLQFYDEKLIEKYVSGLPVNLLPLIREDVEEVKRWLGVEKGETEAARKHNAILWEICKNLDSPDTPNKMLEAGKIRGSLG